MKIVQSVDHLTKSQRKDFSANKRKKDEKIFENERHSEPYKKPKKTSFKNFISIHSDEEWDDEWI